MSEPQQLIGTPTGGARIQQTLRVPSGATLAVEAGGALTGLDSADVGLANVNNTSDADKPVSSATQTALNAKLGATAQAADVNPAGTAIAAALASKQDAISVSVNAHGAVGDGVTDDTAAFVAAGAAAAAAGQEHITADPGTYHCPGLVAASMSDVYIVGDGIQFTGTTYVAAFSPLEWMRRKATDTPAPFTRGAIAITCDDATPAQWSTLFPISKELGFPIATAWPTSWTTGREWLREAWRHGWEIQAHGIDHEDYTALTTAQMRTNCAAQVAAISGITGETDNITFVYPYHYRNATTDEVLRDYFAHARGTQQDGLGYGNSYAFPVGSGNPWMMAAYYMDSDLTETGISLRLRHSIQALSRTNGKALLYFHLSGDAASLLRLPGLRELVRWCRELGVAIVRPNQLFPRNNLILDPHCERPLGDYWTQGSFMTRSDDRAWKGTHSMKLTGRTDGQPWTAACGFGSMSLIPHMTKPGCFGIYRGRYRYYAANNFDRYDANSGIYFQISGMSRKWGAVEPVSYAAQNLGCFPDRNAAFGSWQNPIPAASWALVTREFAIPPVADRIQIGISALNIGGYGTHWPMYIDAIEVEFVGTMPALTFRSTLKGLTARRIHTEIAWVHDHCSVTITPRASVAGRLYVVPVANSTAYDVFSTEAGDNGVAFDLTVTPATVRDGIAVGNIMT